MALVVPSSTPARGSRARRIARIASPLWVAWLSLMFACATASADVVPQGNITEIRVEGNQTISEARVRAKVLSRVGRPLDAATVEADIKTLNNTHWFSQVRAYYDDDKARGGFVLIFQVTEMPVLTHVEFRGRSKLSEKQLQEASGLKVGARADHVRTQLAVSSIRRLYQEKGFQMAEVKLLEGGGADDRRAVFEIFEGPKFKVSSVSFEGNAVLSDALLQTKLKNGPKILGLFGPNYREEGPEEDARRIVEAYQNIGYFEAQCTPVVRDSGSVGNIRLTYQIYEGPEYKVRSIKFDGNEKLKQSELAEGMMLHSGQTFRDTVRAHDTELLRKKYSQIGCIDIEIEPEPQFTDTPGVVDLVYHIREGDQYLVGAVNVHGNERTRDKVVRRELIYAGLLPGEPLDGTRIENAKKRLGNTQFFHMTPEMGGKPVEINIVNRRSGDQPYGEVAPVSIDDVVRTALQSPDDQVPALPDSLPVEPLAPGDGPASVVPFGSGGQFNPPPDVAPGVNSPGVAAPGRRRRGPFGQLPQLPPSENGTPPGTFPPLPGSNMNDVGPDLQEPFSNRGLPNIITQVEPEGNRKFADLDVNVDEAPTGRLMLGVGASSYGGLSGTFILHEKNFDLFNVPRSPREIFNGQAFRGAGQEFRLELSPGTQVNRALISFREPSLFDKPIGFNASGYAFSRFFPDWNEKRGGGRFSLGTQLGTMAYADLAVRVEDVNVSGFKWPAPAEYMAVSGSTFLTTLRPSIFFDTRNDPFLPSSGSYAEAAFEQGWGDFTFPKLTLEARRHFTVRSRPDQTGKHILTLRGFFGITGQDTPLYERFFAGDFRSMRGFAFRGVGPFVLNSNVGGILTTVGSIEYQFPITANDRLQWVVFSDFGTVENTYDINNFRVSVGTGVRVTLPMIGPLPLAFDLAFPVVKTEEDRERLFTFFIGSFF